LRDVDPFARALGDAAGADVFAVVSLW